MKCVICSLSLPHSSSTVVKGHHQCAHCPRYFERSDELNIHLLIHTDKLSYKCSYCPSSFSHKSIYTSHMFGHTGKFPHQCPDCPQGYMKYADLMKHQRTHIVKDMNKCPLCPRNCIHKGKGFLQCPQCPRVFAKGFELKIHLQIHSDKLSYKCPHCPNSFAHKSNYIAHVYEHTGEFPHKCHHCPKGFMKRNDLIKHKCSVSSSPIGVNRQRQNGAKAIIDASCIEKEPVQRVEQVQQSKAPPKHTTEVQRRMSPRVKKPALELKTAESIKKHRKEKQQPQQQPITSALVNLKSKADLLESNIRLKSIKTEPEEEEQHSKATQRPSNVNSRLEASKNVEQPAVKVNKRRSYKCNLCSKEFPNLQQLQLHEK